MYENKGSPTRQRANLATYLYFQKAEKQAFAGCLLIPLVGFTSEIEDSKTVVKICTRYAQKGM
jgi:hypothetical protein